MLLTRGAARVRQVPWRWAGFPVAVLLSFLVLVGLDLNGSSISIVAGRDSGLLAGTPRPIRSDEFYIKTPLAISSERQGFPDHLWVGLSKIDQTTVTAGGPTKDWTEALKPQDWGYLTLGSSRGLAVNWWWPYAITLLGCFALFAVLTRRALLSGLLAVIATFTPSMGWWSSPSPGLFIGNAAMTGACLIAAWQARRRSHAAILAVCAGLFAVAFALALYPPWQVSLGWVIAAVCLGWALDARIDWRRLLWPVAVGLGVAGALLGVWYGQHSAGIRAQQATIYPGRRLSEAGGATLRMLIDAPLNFWMTHSTGATLGVAKYGTGAPGNLSEAASSWLPLPVAALLVLGVLEIVGRRALGDRLVTSRRPAVLGRHAEAPQIGPAPPRGPAPVWTLSLVAASLLLILGWALVPLPGFVGRITQLDRVEPTRTPVALGLALLLLVAVAVVTPRGSRPLVWNWPLLTVAAGLSAALTVWASHHLAWHEAAVSSWLVLLSGLAVGLLFALLLQMRVAALAAMLMAGYAVVSWLPINPLQQGITPLTRAPLVTRLMAVTKGTDNPRTEVFGKDALTLYSMVAQVRSAGLQSLSGTTPYPDADLMTQLAPTQRPRWNNYAQFVWTPAAPGSTATISGIHGTLMRLSISPCDPRLLSLVHPGWAVSDQPLTQSCLSLASVHHLSGAGPRWIYRVHS